MMEIISDMNYDTSEIEIEYCDEKVAANISSWRTGVTKRLSLSCFIVSWLMFDVWIILLVG